MTTTKRSLLDQSKYRNHRYDEDAAELAELEKQATEGAEAQGQEGDAQSKQQEPVHNWEKRYKDLQSYHSKEVNK